MSDYVAPINEWDSMDTEADALIAQANGEQVAPKPDTPPVKPDVMQPKAQAETPTSTLEPMEEEHPKELDGLSVDNAQERIKNAHARMTKATMEAADLRRQMDTLNKERDLLQKEVDLMKRQPQTMPDQSGSGAGVEDAELDEIANDYEMAAPLVAEIKRLKSQLSRLGDESAQRGREAEESRELEARREHTRVILESHSDAREVFASDDFKGWLVRQPGWIQDDAERGNAQQIVNLLDRYKNSVGISQAKKEQHLDRARQIADGSPNPSRSRDIAGRTNFSQAQIEKMSMEEYLAHEEAIDKALAEGRIS